MGRDVMETGFTVMIWEETGTLQQSRVRIWTLELVSCTIPSHHGPHR